MRLPTIGRKHPEPGGVSVIEFLHEVSIFEDLAPEQLVTLREMADTQHFRAGNAIITEGEAGDCMFVLLDGIVDISKSLTLKTSQSEFSTKDKTLTRLKAEQHPFFGEIAMLGTDVRTATVMAVTDCTTLAFTRGDLETLERQHPEIAYAVVKGIAKELCGRLHQQNQNVLKLATALSIALSR